MAFTFKQLQAFVQVAQSNTFAEAAEKMHVSQPALSIAIRKMEEGLGGQLFARTTRTVQLSPEGREFLPLANRLLNDWQDAVTDMNNLFAMQRGKLQIAAMPSFANSLLPKIIADYLRKWDKINVSVQDVVMEQVIDLVLQGRVELGFTFEPEHLDGLEFFPLMTDNFALIDSQLNPIAGERDIGLSDLQHYPFVAMNRESSVRRWLDRLLADKGISLNIVAEAGQLTTLGQFVAQGIGLSVVPGICRQQLGEQQLRFLPLDGEYLNRPIGIIRSSRGNLSVPAMALWQQLTSIN